MSVDDAAPPAARTLRARIDQLATRAADTEAHRHARVRAVLEERARTLSSPAAPPPPADAFAVITVHIAKERYAVEAALVREVIRLGEFAALPGAEPPLFALTAWRGELLPLLDVRRALGLSPTALNDLRHVVVLAGGSTPVGVMVDEVIGMASVRNAEVRPVGGDRGPTSALVRGVTADALIVLATDALARALD